MRYIVTLDGREIAVDLTGDTAEVDGRTLHVEFDEVTQGGLASLLVDGRSHRLLAASPQRGVWRLQLDGRTVEVRVEDERTRAIREMTGAGAGPAGPEPLRAPMPGLVVRVEVEPGQVVGPGDGLVIVEAMKMENELRADAPARVTAVQVAAGDTVERGQVLVELEAVEEG